MKSELKAEETKSDYVNNIINEIFFSNNGIFFIN